MKKKLLMLLGIVLLFCNGCWDKKEFNQLAIAQAIAIDYMDETYQVTIQLLMPKADEEGAIDERLWRIQGCGVAVSEALEEIARETPRELYLDHLEVVLLGEGLLEQDIWEGITYLLDQHVLRRRTKLLAVKGNAGMLLEKEPKLSEVDLFYLSNLLRDQGRRVKGSTPTVNDYLTIVRGDIPQAILIPKVEKREERTLQLNGAAVVQADRLVQWVDAQWMMQYHWFPGGKEIMTLFDVGEQKQKVSVEVQKEKCHWEIVSDDPLCIRANLKGKVYLVEESSQPMKYSLQEMERYQREIMFAVEQEEKKRVTKMIQEMQKQRSDVMHLGRWLSAWHPKMMEGKEWTMLFSKMKIEVQVNLEGELNAMR